MRPSQFNWVKNIKPDKAAPALATGMLVKVKKDQIETLGSIAGAGGESGRNSNGTHYYFEDDGRSMRFKATNMGNDRIVINGKEYELNDPEKDPGRLNAIYDEIQAKIVYPIDQETIDAWMDESGATNHWSVYSLILTALFSVSGFIVSQLLPYLYELFESNEGKLDFYWEHIKPMMVRGGIDEEKYLKKDNGGFCLFPGERKAYNSFDAGNYLWGYAANEMGISLEVAKLGAQVNQRLRARRNETWQGNEDDPYDQIAIADGWKKRASM